MQPALNGGLIYRILLRMHPQLAFPFGPYRQPSPFRASFGLESRIVGSRVIVTVALVFLISTARLVAQAPSGDQGWPQTHQDQPYTDDPGPAEEPSYGQDQSYQSSAVPARQPLEASELEQLVAPLALYPDGLVAQVLAASTYPQQVADANRWRQAQLDVSADEIASGADAQGWDPSVKALTAFPQVLAQMDRNLQWTTDLGTAYYNQPQDVLEAVQVMRRRAQAAGTLRSTPQEVVRYEEGNIVLAPPDPQVVYVPTYNPWTAYGEPVSPYPGFSLLGAIADIAGALPLRYGLGMAMSAFAQTPWGWLAWGLDWLGHALLFDHSDYYSHSGTVADWGFSHRGFYAYRGRGLGRAGHDFARARGGEPWRRGGFNPGGWHAFNRGPERPVEHWGGRSSRSFAANRGFESGRGLESSRGFQSFRNERNGLARPMEPMPDRGAYRSEFNRGTVEFRRGESDRASASNFPRNEFRDLGSFNRASGKSHSGSHLFAGGHSHDNFASIGHSHNNIGGGHGFFHGGGGHAAKSFGGGHGFGGGKGFGGGHSHGGGGGHAGGKHHH